jgi:hypothetical protein
MSEAKQYVSLTFEASDDFPNPFNTPHPFGAVVAFCREDAVSELYRLREVSAELLAAAKRALNFIRKSESELGIALESGDLLRAAIAKAEGK